MLITHINYFGSPRKARMLALCSDTGKCPWWVSFVGESRKLRESLESCESRESGKSRESRMSKKEICRERIFQFVAEFDVLHIRRLNIFQRLWVKSRRRNIPYLTVPRYRKGCVRFHGVISCKAVGMRNHLPDQNSNRSSMPYVGWSKESEFVVLSTELSLWAVFD